MTPGRFKAVAVVCLALGGCAGVTGYPREPFDPGTDLKATQSAFGSDVLANYASARAADRAGRTPRGYRDDVVNARLLAYDIRYSQLEQSLSAAGAGANFAADALIVVSSAFSAGLVHPSAKTSLAAFSAGVVGLKGAVDKDVFYDKTAPVLINEMRAGRAAVLAEVRAGLALDVDRYGLAQALADVRRYADAGSIPGALAGLNASASLKGAKAEEALQDVKHDAAYKQSLVQREAIADRIDKLGDDKALAVAHAMERHLSERSTGVQQQLDQYDPRSLHLTDKTKSANFLYFWVMADDGDLSEWTAALDKAEKG